MSTQDVFLLDCPTHDDYLDTYITSNDIRYLRNIRFCRMLVELGYRSSTDIYTPEQFAIKKAAVQESLWPTKKGAMMFSDRMTSQDPVLHELALREKTNTQKMISSIIFIRYRLKSGFEVSGYIDFEQSLRHANLHMDGALDWLGIFQETCLIRPKTTDLSFFNWHTGQVYYNNSDNFIVMHDVENGLIFMHIGDHKKICVDTTHELYKGNCTRSMHFSEKFGHVTIYDHIVRKKI